MKKAAEKSYLKKGRAIVDLNWAAIDAGADAYTVVDVPAEWKNCAEDAPAAAFKSPRPELEKFVNTVVTPTNAMAGDKLPVSAFTDYVDGTFPQGSSASEKRGVAVTVPTWIPENCIQCNNCAFVCPHAAIRPFAMTAEEAANAPAATKFTAKPVIKTDYKFTMAVSPLDCMGCTLCVKACPVTANAAKTGKAPALEMKPIATQLDQQAAYDYAVANVKEKSELVAP